MSVSAIRHSVLDEAGDLDAAPGSRPWAVAVRLRMQAALRDERSTAEHLKRLMALLNEHRGFAALDDRFGAPFPTLEAFCLAPSPCGLGYALDAINGIIEERKSAEARARAPKDLAKPGEIGRGRERDSERIPNQGETSDYLTARIARDRPDILGRMRAGAYPSVRAAALEAGIVRRRVSIPADDCDRAARALVRHFDAGELIAALYRACQEASHDAMAEGR